jgi:hypothetical protein
MAETKIIGYKNIFGFVLPDWVDEKIIRLLVTFLLSSVVMFFVLIFVVWPKFAIITEMNSSLKTGETALSSLKSSKAGFDQINEQIPEVTQNLVLSAIPTTYSPENAVFLLRKLGSEVPGLAIVAYKLPSGVLYEVPETATIKPKTEDKEMVSFVSYPIRLTVTAPVESLLSFINKIEASLPFGVVSDMGMQEVSKLAKSTASKSVQMELQVSYYQALLKQVDISKIQPISADDIALVKKISGFSKATYGTVDVGVSPVATGSSGSLFGF